VGLFGVAVGWIASRVWKKPCHCHGPAMGFGAGDMDAQWPESSGNLTPERMAVHRRLMETCYDPSKLQRAAMLFGNEGLADLARQLLGRAAEVHQQMHGAKDLVERFRAGDQHAIAMIDAIGQAARGGNQRAAVSRFLIWDYTAKNPAQGPVGPKVAGVAA